MIATVHPRRAPNGSIIAAERYLAAQPFPVYVESVVRNRDWWQSAYRVATAADADVTRATQLRSPWRLLALSEDWCGDAVNILPYVARLAEAAPATLELRVLGRDANADIMNAHLTGRSRSIPIVITLDGDYVEHGWWGPRPLTLQRQAVTDWWHLPKDERRLLIRTWYARDRGRQILQEILQLLETVTAMK